MTTKAKASTEEFAEKMKQERVAFLDLQHTDSPAPSKIKAGTFTQKVKLKDMLKL